MTGLLNKISANQLEIYIINDLIKSQTKTISTQQQTPAMAEK
jgi:hypothetical protein